MLSMINVSLNSHWDLFVNLYHFYDGFIEDSSQDLDLVKSKASKFLNNRQNLNPNKKLNFKRLIKNKKYYGLFTEDVSLDDPHYQAHAQIKLLAESYECDIFNVAPEGFDSQIYKKIKWENLKKMLWQKWNVKFVTQKILIT